MTPPDQHRRNRLSVSYNIEYPPAVGNDRRQPPPPLSGAGARVDRNTPIISIESSPGPRERVRVTPHVDVLLGRFSTDAPHRDSQPNEGRYGSELPSSAASRDTLGRSQSRSRSHSEQPGRTEGDVGPENSQSYSNSSPLSPSRERIWYGLDANATPRQRWPFVHNQNLTHTATSRPNRSDASCSADTSLSSYFPGVPQPTPTSDRFPTHANHAFQPASNPPPQTTSCASQGQSLQTDPQISRPPNSSPPFEHRAQAETWASPQQDNGASRVRFKEGELNTLSQGIQDLDARVTDMTPDDASILEPMMEIKTNVNTLHNNPNFRECQDVLQAMKQALERIETKVKEKRRHQPSTTQRGPANEEIAASLATVQNSLNGIHGFLGKVDQKMGASYAEHVRTHQENAKTQEMQHHLYREMIAGNEIGRNINQQLENLATQAQVEAARMQCETGTRETQAQVEAARKQTEAQFRETQAIVREGHLDAQERAGNIYAAVNILGQRDHENRQRTEEWRLGMQGAQQAAHQEVMSKIGASTTRVQSEFEDMRERASHLYAQNNDGYQLLVKLQTRLDSFGSGPKDLHFRQMVLELESVIRRINSDLLRNPGVPSAGALASAVQDARVDLSTQMGECRSEIASLMANLTEIRRLFNEATRRTGQQDGARISDLLGREGQLKTQLAEVNAELDNKTQQIKDLQESEQKLRASLNDYATGADALENTILEW